MTTTTANATIIHIFWLVGDRVEISDDGRLSVGTGTRQFKSAAELAAYTLLHDDVIDRLRYHDEAKRELRRLARAA